MSTFDGLIREFPSVAIDNFRIRAGVSTYLLSHVHSDHLAGLASKAWDAPIFCSAITATWLPLLASRSNQEDFESGRAKVMQRRYAHLAPFLKPLITETAHYLELGNGRRVRCTLIPAHHCPGAVMFLLQDDRSCILYTGDARNETVDLMGLGTMSIFSASAPRIDRLYLDTTCCHPGLYNFPSRDLVVSDLITFITHRPRLAHYYIDAWTFGYEEIWIGLSKAFNTKIHVSPYLYELYTAIDDMIHPRILPHLTLEGTYARFHSCRLGSTCGYGGAGGSAHTTARELIRIQPNVSWFSEKLQKERQQDSIFAKGQTVMRGNAYTVKERLPPSIAKRDDLCYYINFACHASLCELEQLVKLVRPRMLFPCVLHRDSISKTHFRSNQEIVELLAKHMPTDRGPLSTARGQYEEYRGPQLSDGVTTDFQSFHQVKGYNLLDMNDEVLGIQPLEDAVPTTAATPGSKARRSSPSPILSPRSTHLRHRMKKLKRQLRNTASLEEEKGHRPQTEDFRNGADEDSSMDEGPLTFDLEEMERKRKWWLQTEERGKSTTQEDTTQADETDPHISVGLQTGDRRPGHVESSMENSHQLDASDLIIVLQGEKGPGKTSLSSDAMDPVFEQSTLDFEIDVSLAEMEPGLEHIRCGTTVSPAPATRVVEQPTSPSPLNKGYLSSSPDPIFSSLSDSSPVRQTPSSFSQVISTWKSLPDSFQGELEPCPTQQPSIVLSNPFMVQGEKEDEALPASHPPLTTAPLLHKVLEEPQSTVTVIVVSSDESSLFSSLESSSMTTPDSPPKVFLSSGASLDSHTFISGGHGHGEKNGAPLLISAGGVALGGSPTKSRTYRFSHHTKPVAQPRFDPPGKKGPSLLSNAGQLSLQNQEQLQATAHPPATVLSPPGNIFTYLACSPPRKPLWKSRSSRARLERAATTDSRLETPSRLPHFPIDTPPKRAETSNISVSRRAVCDGGGGSNSQQEVILIESSDEDDRVKDDDVTPFTLAPTTTKYTDDQEHGTNCGPATKSTSPEPMDSQDENWLQFG